MKVYAICPRCKRKIDIRICVIYDEYIISYGEGGLIFNCPYCKFRCVYFDGDLDFAWEGKFLLSVHEVK